MSGNYLTFLLDTGASISLIRCSKLLFDFPVDSSAISHISGIKKGFIQTMGVTFSDLLIDDSTLRHSFHVVGNDFPIPADGIIGLDFLRKYKCKLDFFKWKLTIRRSESHSKLTIPIFDHPSTNSNDCQNVFAVPARCEVVRRINVTTDGYDKLVHNQEIQPGVFIGRTIISGQNSYIRILNSNDENVTVTEPPIAMDDLSDYTVVNPDKIECTDRNFVLQKLQKNFPKFAHDELTQLCKKYLDIFALETDKISVNNFYKQKLRLKDDVPVYIKNYRIPHAHKDKIDKMVDNMLKNGTIEPSRSEYNSPILLVPKKSLPNNPEKRWRFCVDYRAINKKLLSDTFPLPRVDDILDQLGRARLFSCIDFLNGFHQIELEKDSKDITSFSTDKGSFRFNSIPFGLKIGPNSFQRMMTLAFASLPPNQGFIYMDDLVVIAVSEKQMIKNLTQVFEICRDVNLKLNPDKCEFFRSEVTYLGHKCTEQGISPDESKFEIIQNYPRPTDADSARRFVAFCNYYRRFIPNFAYYSSYITHLTKKKVKYFWSDNCEKAFQYLKRALTAKPILKYPDFNKPFCITTDASKIACGAVLSQDYDGVQLPVSFASRAFTKGERNKSTPLQELTAIHWALKHFRPYIFGTKFLVRSDHRPLIYLYSMKDPSSKLMRIRLELEEYDFEIQHIRGKENVIADALSRIDFKKIRDNAVEVIDVVYKMQTRSATRAQSGSNCQPEMTKNENERVDYVPIYDVLNPIEVKDIPVIYFNLKTRRPKCVIKLKRKTLNVLNLSQFINAENQLDLGKVLVQLENEMKKLNFLKITLSLNDEIFTRMQMKEFKFLGTKFLNKLTIALTPKLKIVRDPEEVKQLLIKYHNDPLFGGHCGKKRMYLKLKIFFYWKNMTKDIDRFVKNCKHCQENKMFFRNKEPLKITETPTNAFDLVFVDTIGPFVKSDDGNVYAVTLMCGLTKYLISVPIVDKSAPTVAKAIFDNFILTYGPMKVLTSDRGTEYVNEILTELCKLLKIDRRTSTAYHHRSLGTVERSHRTFNEYVRSYINQGKTDWDHWLKFFTYCFNTTPSTSIGGYCPFSLIFGKLPANYSFLNSDQVDPVYNFDAYHLEIKYRLQCANRLAQKFLKKFKYERKITYDEMARPMPIAIDDLVLIENEPRHKLDPMYKGPFRVKELQDPNAVLVDEKNKKQILVHKDKIKILDKCFYFRFHNNSFTSHI